MPRRVELRGLSGAAYSFMPLEEVPIRPVGVTYVFAEQTAGQWRLLRASHTNNMAEEGWAASLAEVRRAHPAAEVLIRLNISRRVREAEADDLSATIG